MYDLSKVSGERGLLAVWSIALGGVLSSRWLRLGALEVELGVDIAAVEAGKGRREKEI
jgi:hypothetical protein